MMPSRIAAAPFTLEPPASRKVGPESWTATVSGALRAAARMMAADAESDRSGFVRDDLRPQRLAQFAEPRAVRGASRSSRSLAQFAEPSGVPGYIGHLSAMVVTVADWRLGGGSK
jgi:hypothetical protein